MEINNVIKELSNKGLINILSQYNHINMKTIISRDDLEQVAQHNINDLLIDEFEFINELSGE